MFVGVCCLVMKNAVSRKPSPVFSSKKTTKCKQPVTSQPKKVDKY